MIKVATGSPTTMGRHLLQLRPEGTRAQDLLGPWAGMKFQTSFLVQKHHRVGTSQGHGRATGVTAWPPLFLSVTEDRVFRGTSPALSPPSQLLSAISPHRKPPSNIWFQSATHALLGSIRRFECSRVRRCTTGQNIPFKPACVLCTSGPLAL